MVMISNEINKNYSENKYIMKKKKNKQFKNTNYIFHIKLLKQNPRL